MKYLSIIFCTLFLLSSCKKDEESGDTCTNNFKDIGEEGVDCGGVCPDCPMVFLNDLRIKLNSVDIPFSVKTFTELNNNWYLNFSNDTIQIQLQIGDNLVVDSNYQLIQANSFAIINGVNYPFITSNNSVCAISEIFATEQRISGLFDANFFRNGFTDTMKVSSGEFIHLPF